MPPGLLAVIESRLLYQRAQQLGLIPSPGSCASSPEGATGDSRPGRATPPERGRDGSKPPTEPAPLRSTAMTASTFQNTPGEWADLIVKDVGAAIADRENVGAAELAESMRLVELLRAEQARLDKVDFTDPPPSTQLPAWVREKLADLDYLVSELTIVAADGIRVGMADRTLARDLLDGLKARRS